MRASSLRSHHSVCAGFRREAAAHGEAFRLQREQREVDVEHRHAERLGERCVQ